MDDPLTGAAGRIADGAEVDWAGQLERTPGLKHRLVLLHRVQRIAEAWRAVGVHAPDEAGVATPAPARPAVFRWGALEALDKLGEGSFGEVWRAWDPTLEREVALKLRRAVPDPDEASARRELEEARTLARVRHPNVLQVYGVDVRDNRAGLWTELVRGRTLEEELAGRRLGAEEALHVGLELCRALAAVHAAQLVHGDLKAANVMREDGGRIVLMDFGSGRRTDLGRGPAIATATPLTTAPEVLRGAPPTPAADLYSLGVLLFRLVTGRYPVEASNLDELLDRHRRGERRSLRALRPDLPRPFVETVERALAHDPALRYADAGAMESALAANLQGGRAPVASRTPVPARRGVTPLAIAAGAGLALVALAVLWPRLARRPAEPPVTPGAIDPSAGEPVTRVGAPEAPAPVSPAPAARPDQPPLYAEAALYKVAADGRRSPLSDGSAVTPGDHLHLEYQGEERTFVYVLSEDETGEVYALFPLAGSDLSNPLPAGGTHRLPGPRAGQPFDWVVTSAGGREWVLVVAAREPLQPLEQAVATAPAPREEQEILYARVKEESFVALRGLGGLAPSPATAGRARKLDALWRELASRPGTGVWVRRIELESR